jgi:hypothetical protein
MAVGMRSFRFVWAPLLLAASSLLQSCVVEPSSLSQVEVSDPYLITPRFTVEKSVDSYSGNASYTYRADLLDANGDYIDLMYGYVTLNGHRMTVSSSGTRRYLLASSKLSYKADFLYTFSVKLSDGKTYNASVRTPKDALQTVTALKNSDSITVAWTGNTTDSLKFEYFGWKGYIDADGEGAETLWNYFGSNASNQGRFGIPPPYMLSGRYNAAVFTSGTIDSAFHPGGRIRGVSEIRNLTIMYP